MNKLYNLNWKYFQQDCLRDFFPSNWWLINTCIWKLAVILFINWHQLCETYLDSEISSFLLAATLCFFFKFALYKNCAFDWIFKKISAEMNKLLYLNWKYFQQDCLKDCFSSNWWLIKLIINTCTLNERQSKTVILFINWDQLCEIHLHSEISSC